MGKRARAAVITGGLAVTTSRKRSHLLLKAPNGTFTARTTVTSVSDNNRPPVVWTVKDAKPSPDGTKLRIVIEGPFARRRRGSRGTGAPDGGDITVTITEPGENVKITN